jgi:uncharacterized protein (TIGR00297 family)
MEFLTLDVGGVILGVIFGILFVVLGMNLGVFFVLAMITFLVFSAAATYVGARYKKRLGVGQEPRGVKNVLANGLPPMIMAALFYLFVMAGNGTFALLSVIGFVASVAAITADKFSSEIGVLSGNLPRMIFTGKKVKRGTSGGLTLMGAVAGLVGAFLVASLIMLIIGQMAMFKSVYAFGIRRSIIAITIAGFVGSLVDSVFGYWEEKGIGNKYTSNFICGVVAGFVAMFLFIII